jgi:hypothetical protein
MRRGFREWYRVVVVCGVFVVAIAGSGLGTDWYGMTVIAGTLPA